MNNTWSHLPNAQHITDVIELVKKYPMKFRTELDAAYDAARSVARAVAWNAAYDAVYDAARNAAYNAAWPAARNAAYNAARNAAYDAILAFIAYDDSTKYLQMTYDQLRIWTELSGDPAAILLLPYVKARELIKAKT